MGFGHMSISEPIPVDRDIRYFGHPGLGHSATPSWSGFRDSTLPKPHGMRSPWERVSLCTR